MKRFVISEDERRRILSMHESATKRQYLSEQGVDSTLTGPTGTGAFTDTSAYRGFTPEQKSIFEKVYAAWNKGGAPAYYDANKNIAYYYAGEKKKGQDDNFDGVQYGINVVRPNKPGVAADGSITYPYFWPTQVIQGSQSGKPEIDGLGWNIKDAKDLAKFDENLFNDYRLQNQMGIEIVKQLLLKSLDKVTDQNQRQQIVQAIKDNPSIGQKYKSVFAEA